MTDSHKLDAKQLDILLSTTTNSTYDPASISDHTFFPPYAWKSGNSLWTALFYCTPKWSPLTAHHQLFFNQVNSCDTSTGTSSMKQSPHWAPTTFDRDIGRNRADEGLHGTKLNERVEDLLSE